MSARNPSNAPRGSAITPPPKNDEPSAPPNKESEFKKPTFWVNVLTLIVVGVYTCFACSQVRETQTANSIAKKALAEVNKPYVMFTGIQPNYTNDKNGRHLHMGVQWTNLGTTPAHFVRVFNCDPIVRDNLVQPQFVCNVSEDDLSKAERVLGPKQSTTALGSIIKESDFEATRDEAKAIYVFGYVTYEDSIEVDNFGNPEQRTTRFCQRVIQPTILATSATSPPVTNIVNPPAGAPITSVAALDCNAFTCMDSTCRPLK